MELITDFEKPMIVGVILDISQMFTSQGDRHIELTKSALVDLSVQMGMSGRLYMSHPDNEMPRNQGESVCQIAEYQQPDPFYLDLAIKCAVHLVGNEDEQAEKHILYITDKCTEDCSYRISKGFMANDKNDYGCSFHLIGITQNSFQHMKHMNAVYCDPYKLISFLTDLRSNEK